MDDKYCWCGAELENGGWIENGWSMDGLACPVHKQHWRLPQETVIALVGVLRDAAAIPVIDTGRESDEWKVRAIWGLRFAADATAALLPEKPA